MVLPHPAKYFRIHTAEALWTKLHDFSAALSELADPRLKCAIIVYAYIMDIFDMEESVHRRADLSRRRNASTWINIFIHPGIDVIARLMPYDSMERKHTAGLERLVRDLEIRPVVARANVLEHLRGRCRVEKIVRAKVTIVLHPHIYSFAI